MSAQEAAIIWGISKRRVQLLCKTGRISGSVKLGNMWVIPAGAEKPSDKRVKRDKSAGVPRRSARPARNMIKSATAKSMGALLSAGYSHADAKTAVVSVLASELLAHLCGGDPAAAESALSRVTCRRPADGTELENIHSAMRKFIEKYPSDCDDALSWCYQFANKIGSDSPYKDTQFFTEKFMITTIVGAIDLPSRKKIFDPACGGGNFLLYCLGFLSANLPRGGDKLEYISRLNEVLSKLNGYEIDPVLAVVASVNLRLKCIALLAAGGFAPVPDDILLFSPNIYYPAEKTCAGALELNKTQQRLIKIGSDSSFYGDAVFRDVDAIITNPPFQTVKGMPEELKWFLKGCYPLSKCDMCNAFIEFSAELLAEGGIAGLVTQNSWMHLDSFAEFRQLMLSSRKIERIWELGSNAFYDLNGEKANVVLLVFRNTPPAPADRITLTSLKSLPIPELENVLASKAEAGNYEQTFLQSVICQSEGARFDLTSSHRLRELLAFSEKYGSFACPMQGTSTGDAKKLIDFSWNHFGDPDWVCVSKGGGYARWQGLNHYCVKWGKNGEYIKEQKGSALRNANFFRETQMVFSDTGTSGLNVRALHQGQIFVASGPGIRVLRGDPYSHLAFLNSRLASYYIRLLSPKLTIAAGYIAKLPVRSEILDSAFLGERGKKCLALKTHRLEKRPYHLEFRYLTGMEDARLDEVARSWFLQDLNDEWEQLRTETEIDGYIYRQMGIAAAELEEIDRGIGCKQVFRRKGERAVEDGVLIGEIKKILDENCEISRTKANKNAMGCDGLLEYLSQKTEMSCETLYFRMKDGFYPAPVRQRYEDLLYHAIVLSALDFRNRTRPVAVSQLLKNFSPRNTELLTEWITTSFERVHYLSFLKSYVCRYDQDTATFVFQGGDRR